MPPVCVVVLTNNYVGCDSEELGDSDASYRQIIGAAMGTPFSVVYAIIFMLQLVTQILDDKRFSQHIRLYT